MPTPHLLRRRRYVRLLIALVVLAVSFSYACGNGNGPTAPATPPTGSATGSVGSNVLITAGSHIDIEKATNGQDADDPLGPQIPIGDPVTWTYVVTNTGSLPLIGIVVTDDQIGAIDCPFKTLASGKTMTCTASGVAEAGPYRNVATATGTTSQGQDAIDQDASHYFGISPGEPNVDIEKATNGEDADDAPGPEVTVGDPVEWTYVVTNLGDVPLEQIAVTDDLLGAIVCPATTLAAGESMTCTADGVAVEGQYVNVGSVVASTAAGDEVDDADTSHYLGVPFAPAPSIDVEKATNGLDADRPAGPVVAVGDPVTWTYVVTNTGNVDLSAVSVTDDQIGAISCPAAQLAVGESMTCEAQGIALEGQYVNVATAVGTDPDGTVVDDDDPSHYFGLVDVPGALACGHGYWKNHLAEWAETPYTPGDRVGDVFASTSAYPYIADSTFLEALQFPGGPGVDGAIRIVMRQAIAALLNATHPDFASPHTVQEIIDMVDTAIETGDRQTILSLNGKLNEDNNVGCTLD